MSDPTGGASLGGVNRATNTANTTQMLAGISVTANQGGDALALAESPGYPVFYVDVKRRGKEGKMSFAILPTSFEYVSSIHNSDKLEFTVPDPSYFLIDSEWLQEDLKTTVEFSFGFEHVGHMSPVQSLVFFRQGPSFEQGSEVQTTIVAYDKGVFLALPTVPRTITKKGTRGGQDVLLTYNEVVENVVNEVNTLFKDHLDHPLRVDTGGHEFRGRFFRMAQHAGSALEYLIWLRKFAEEQTGTERQTIEVFVKGNTVYFRPAQKRVNPIAVYDYFSVIDGERLLSFKPEVNLVLTRKTLPDVDSVTGQATETTVSNRQNAPDRPRQTGFVSTSGANMTQVVTPARTGDQPRATAQADDVVYTHTYKAGETLASIGAQYGVTADEVFAQNADALGGDKAAPKFTPGMTLNIRTENPARSQASANVTPENRIRAALSYVYEEDEVVKATATVIGDPRLEAGWPIVVRNVGKKWEGLWYIEEVKHKFETGGYICEMSLTRDGFAIAEEMEESTGEKILETDAQDAQTQRQTQSREVINTSGADMTQTRTRN